MTLPYNSPPLRAFLPPLSTIFWGCHLLCPAHLTDLPHGSCLRLISRGHVCTLFKFCFVLLLLRQVHDHLLHVLLAWHLDCSHPEAQVRDYQSSEKPPPTLQNTQNSLKKIFPKVPGLKEPTACCVA